MAKRYVSVWLRYLKTDWFSRRQSELKRVPFVLRTPSHGRMIITATNAVAEAKGVFNGMVLADARALVPDLEVQDDDTGLAERLLRYMAEWCIRFTPVTAIDVPDGIVLDASGCSHLWGGDEQYVNNIVKKFYERGYYVRVAIADTIAGAWAVARYGRDSMIINSGEQGQALLNLPPESLRLEPEAIERLHKLGLHQVRQFINMPRSSLRRRFGNHMITRLDMALGFALEQIDPVIPPEPYSERLPCMEPIVTAEGISIALRQLLETMCTRLQQEQKGLRKAFFKGLRVDGHVEQIEMITNRPTHHVDHLFKLFEIKLNKIEPGMGIELFVLDAPLVEDHLPAQEKIWECNGGLEDVRLAELLDRLANKAGIQIIHRYLPAEHYWPERSFQPSSSLQDLPTTTWRRDKLRPLQLITPPEVIDVTAPIPDYPPMLFRHKGKVHQIVKADGPERIEQEWWLQQGQHRDYYRVEDEAGHRYWLFRLGHYHDKSYQWFLHGYFA